MMIRRALATLGAAGAVLVSTAQPAQAWGSCDYTARIGQYRYVETWETRRSCGGYIEKRHWFWWRAIPGSYWLAVK